MKRCPTTGGTMLVCFLCLVLAGLAMWCRWVRLPGAGGTAAPVRAPALLGRLGPQSPHCTRRRRRIGWPRTAPLDRLVGDVGRDHHERREGHHMLARTVGALTAMFLPVSILAQDAQHASTCNEMADCAKTVKCGLARTVRGGGRLAVKIGDEWAYLRRQDDPLVIRAAGVDDLCMAWEAPRSGGSNQIVYAGTKFSRDQQILLYRNGAAPIKFFRRFFGDWSSTLGNDRERFRNFHKESPKDREEWSLLRDWHDTSAWLPDRGSFELVKRAVADKRASVPYGTERLLLVQPNRPLSSWIPIETKPPSNGERLHVAISYSGDSDPFVYRYTLSVSNP